MSKKKCIATLPCLLIITQLFKLTQCSSELTISTYNIWNIMFNWDVRKYKIAELIRNAGSDIIAFQEVRSDEVQAQNQLLDLKEILPSFKWFLYKDANSVSAVKGSTLNVWNKEGIGLLSKYPIISSSIEQLPFSKGPDTNRRVALHAAIQLKTDQVVNVVVVHFSYYRQQQCANAAAVLEFIVGKKLTNVIVLGDFNTYSDYNWPVSLMTQRSVNPSSPCYRYLHMSLKPPNTILFDVWETHDKHRNGLTFSNMPTPGFESRPDRILVDGNFHIQSVDLSGNGTLLQQSHHRSIIFNRFQMFIHASYLAYQNIKGYPCLHDCGPRGSCRCGICVRGDNQNNCLIEDCSECRAETLIYFIIFLVLFFIVLSHLFFAVVMILVIASNFEGETFFSILGCNCCLCNPQLFVKRRARRYRFLRICYHWPLFKLPPALLFVISLIVLMLLSFITKHFFRSSLDTVNTVMVEEYFSSDHLLLTSKLVLQ